MTSHTHTHTHTFIIWLLDTTRPLILVCTQKESLHLFGFIESTLKGNLWDFVTRALFSHLDGSKFLQGTKSVSEFKSAQY